MQTNYLRNSVHELPLGRVIINVPFEVNNEFVTWMKEQNEEMEFKHHVILAEVWGSDVWLPTAKYANAAILDVTNKDKKKFERLSCTKSHKIIYGNVEADGVVIPKGDCFGIATGDCPTLVFSDLENDLMIATHAGRPSLLDMKKIHTGRASRENFGVVESAMKLFSKHGSTLSNIEVGVFCGIGPKHFGHSLTCNKYGEKNKKLFAFLLQEYGSKTFQKINQHALGIDLFEVIVAQCEKYGIPRHQIEHDNVDTGKESFIHPRAREKFKSELASHRRKTNSRNFIMVQHNRSDLVYKDPVSKDLFIQDG